MTNPKITTVQDIYAAFGRGDVATILECVTDDVDWASEPEGAAPWHGIHRGKTELPHFFHALAEHLDVTEFTPLTYAANDTDVLTVIRFAIRAKQTGRTGAMELHHWWRFRDGKVALYRGTEDTALTARLLGLSLAA
jgi:uncharacterized protein